MNRQTPLQATSRPRVQLMPPFLAGLAFGVVASAGSAMLLYTTQGFLRAAGLLIALAIGALAAGVWAGGAGLPRTRGRWLAVLVAYILAVLAVLAWSGWPALRTWHSATALAMLLVLALPAYATGLLLGGREAGNGVTGLSGGTCGVLLATAALIPNLSPAPVFAGAAAAVVLALLVDWRRAAERGGGMSQPVAIVTGVGARGQLGFAIARHLAANGWRVLVTGRRDAVQSLAAELAGGTDRVAGARADLLDQADADSVVRAALDRFGRVDGLVNAAGGLTLVRPVEDTHLEELQRELDRNLATVLVMSRAALPALRDSAGAIVNFASPAAFQPAATLAAYSAAKAGVVALTAALALEEQARGVRVNAVAPAMMDTDQNQAEAGADAQYVSRGAVADVVLFLLSPAARAITGETIRVLVPTAQ